RLAQLRAGDGLRFEPCTLAEARRLAIEQRQRLARIALAIAARG
ncbi:MAG: allophanate hydrolase subunit 2 family protein, partial [Luteimonas sp.]|nr:allophanate hydrolase subunit 2 family protein [Luteimonas sp.]